MECLDVGGVLAQDVVPADLLGRGQIGTDREAGVKDAESPDAFRPAGLPRRDPDPMKDWVRAPPLCAPRRRGSRQARRAAPEPDACRGRPGLLLSGPAGCHRHHAARARPAAPGGPAAVRPPLPGQPGRPSRRGRRGLRRYGDAGGRRRQRLRALPARARCGIGSRPGRFTTSPPNSDRSPAEPASRRMVRHRAWEAPGSSRLHPGAACTSPAGGAALAWPDQQASGQLLAGWAWSWMCACLRCSASALT